MKLVFLLLCVPNMWFLLLSPGQDEDVVPAASAQDEASPPAAVSNVWFMLFSIKMKMVLLLLLPKMILVLLLPVPNMWFLLLSPKIKMVLLLLLPKMKLVLLLPCPKCGSCCCRPRGRWPSYCCPR